MVRTYEDVGLSGAKTKRPGLDAMLADAQAGRFDVVLVWKFDRLGRSVSHLLQVLDQFQGWGVAFASARDPGIDTSDTIRSTSSTRLSSSAVVPSLHASFRAIRTRPPGRAPRGVARVESTVPDVSHPSPAAPQRPCMSPQLGSVR